MIWHAFFLALSMGLFQGNLFAESGRWLAFYGKDASMETLSQYNPIVLDSDNHPLIMALVHKGKTALGYISSGEAEKERGYFSQVDKHGLLLEENKNWPGSYFIDLRNPLWAQLLVEELVPGVLMQRFNGVFLDTLDNAEFLEKQDPKKYAGMVQAAENLVRAIRQNFPQIQIMMNRGFALLLAVAPFIDMVLGESIYTQYDFRTQTYRLADPEVYLELSEKLKKAKELNPKLVILTLDYWDPGDKEGIKKIYAVQRKNGFVPYVATVDLQKIIEEP